MSYILPSSQLSPSLVPVPDWIPGCWLGVSFSTVLAPSGEVKSGLIAVLEVHIGLVVTES